MAPKWSTSPASFLVLLLFSSSYYYCTSTVSAAAPPPPSVVSALNAHRRHHRALKTIQSEDGDIIDCIELTKQPAFDHPSLKNHQIQMAPTFQPDAARTRTNTTTDEPFIRTTQLWQRSGSCPQATIPVRRIHQHHNKMTLRKGYNNPPFSHHAAAHNHRNNGGQFKQDKQKIYLIQPNHSLAILLTEGFRYLGAKGDIKVYNPQVESDDDYSTSHIALRNGPSYKYEEIQSGWAVNPRVYGDKQTRLFVYWTADSSKETGCFDLTCPGFVQTSKEIALGAAIYPISNPTGLPYQITIFIHKDPNTNNWWVQYGESINIGYWPPEMFTSLRYQAQIVQWGGEVFSPKVGGAGPHTATAMGSGYFPDYVFGRSGVIKRMRVLENELVPKEPEWAYSYTDEYRCYDVFYLSDYVEDPEFYYGGPGRNPLCP